MERRQLRSGHPVTPDGRYFVVGGRLWRMSNPALSEQEHAELVRRLGAARQAVRRFKRDLHLLSKARDRVDEIKRALGERGDVWWDDGAPDYNRHMAQNSPYAAWFWDIRAEARAA